MNVVAFSGAAPPEFSILLMSLALTFGSVLCVLLSFGFLSQYFGVKSDIRLWIISYALVGIPAFYAWNVFSFMDVTLWTFLINALMLTFLLRIGAIIKSSVSGVIVSILAVIMGLARPEAMMLMPTLLLIGLLGEWQLERSKKDTVIVYGFGFLCSLITSGVLAYIRILYFGVPFPNTYYALVSSNPIDNIKNGISYFATYNATGAFSDVLILAVLGTFIVSIWKSFFSEGHHRHFYRGLFVISATSLLVFSLSIVDGGDHFGSFRLYQPIHPLMIAMFCAIVLAVVDKIPNLSRTMGGIGPVLLVTLTSSYLASSMITFYKKNDFYMQFESAKEHRLLGVELNKTVARIQGARIAVIAAGGVAMTFKGRVLDLLGLNWPLMAHATKRRTGLPGHSAFDKTVFWEERPVIVLPYLGDKIPTAIYQEEYYLKILHGLTESKRFKRRYEAIAIPVDNVYILTFALRSWVKKYQQFGTVIPIQ